MSNKIGNERNIKTIAYGLGGLVGLGALYGLTAGLEKALTGSLDTFANRLPSFDLDKFRNTDTVGEGLRDVFGNATVIYGALFAMLACYVLARKPSQKVDDSLNVNENVDENNASATTLGNSTTTD